LSEENGKKLVTLLSWKGSGDLKTLAEANCLAIFPGEERAFRTGEELAVLRL